MNSRFKKHVGILVLTATIWSVVPYSGNDFRGENANATIQPASISPMSINDISALNTTPTPTFTVNTGDSTVSYSGTSITSVVLVNRTTGTRTSIASGASVSMPTAGRYDVEVITAEGTYTKSATVTASSIAVDTISAAVSNKQLEVSGLTSGDTVTVHFGGNRVGSAVATGAVEIIPISDVETGEYIIQVEDKKDTFKITATSRDIGLGDVIPVIRPDLDSASVTYNIGAATGLVSGDSLRMEIKGPSAVVGTPVVLNSFTGTGLYSGNFVAGTDYSVTYTLTNASGQVVTKEFDIIETDIVLNATGQGSKTSKTIEVSLPIAGSGLKVRDTVVVSQLTEDSTNIKIGNATPATHTIEASDKVLKFSVDLNKSIDETKPHTVLFTINGKDIVSDSFTVNLSDDVNLTAASATATEISPNVLVDLGALSGITASDTVTITQIHDGTAAVSLGSTTSFTGQTGTVDLAADTYLDPAKTYRISLNINGNPTSSVITFKPKTIDLSQGSGSASEISSTVSLNLGAASGITSADTVLVTSINDGTSNITLGSTTSFSGQTGTIDLAAATSLDPAKTYTVSLSINGAPVKGKITFVPTAFNLSQATAVATEIGSNVTLDLGTASGIPSSAAVAVTEIRQGSTVVSLGANTTFNGQRGTIDLAASTYLDPTKTYSAKITVGGKVVSTPIEFTPNAVTASGNATATETTKEIKLSDFTASVTGGTVTEIKVDRILNSSGTGVVTPNLTLTSGAGTVTLTSPLPVGQYSIVLKVNGVEIDQRVAFAVGENVINNTSASATDVSRSVAINLATVRDVLSTDEITVTSIAGTDRVNVVETGTPQTFIGSTGNVNLASGKFLTGGETYTITFNVNGSRDYTFTFVPTESVLSGTVSASNVSKQVNITGVDASGVTSETLVLKKIVAHDGTEVWTGSQNLTSGNASITLSTPLGEPVGGEYVAQFEVNGKTVLKPLNVTFTTINVEPDVNEVTEIAKTVTLSLKNDGLEGDILITSLKLGSGANLITNNNVDTDGDSQNDALTMVKDATTGKYSVNATLSNALKANTEYTMTLSVNGAIMTKQIMSKVTPINTVGTAKADALTSELNIDLNTPEFIASLGAGGKANVETAQVISVTKTLPSGAQSSNLMAAGATGTIDKATLLGNVTLSEQILRGNEYQVKYRINGVDIVQTSDIVIVDTLLGKADLNPVVTSEISKGISFNIKDAHINAVLTSGTVEVRSIKEDGVLNAEELVSAATGAKKTLTQNAAKTEIAGTVDLTKQMVSGKTYRVEMLVNGTVVYGVFTIDIPKVVFDKSTATSDIVGNKINYDLSKQTDLLAAGIEKFEIVGVFGPDNVNILTGYQISTDSTGTVPHVGTITTSRTPKVGDVVKFKINDLVLTNTLPVTINSVDTTNINVKVDGITNGVEIDASKIPGISEKDVIEVTSITKTPKSSTPSPAAAPVEVLDKTKPVRFNGPTGTVYATEQFDDSKFDYKISMNVNGNPVAGAGLDVVVGKGHDVDKLIFNRIDGDTFDLDFTHSLTRPSDKVKINKVHPKSDNTNNILKSPKVEEEIGTDNKVRVELTKDLINGVVHVIEYTIIRNGVSKTFTKEFTLRGASIAGGSGSSSGGSSSSNSSTNISNSKVESSGRDASIEYKTNKEVKEIKVNIKGVSATYDKETGKINLDGLIPNKEYKTIIVNVDGQDLVIRNFKTPESDKKIENYVANVYKFALKRDGDEEGYAFHIEKIGTDESKLKEFLVNLLKEEEFINLHKTSEDKIRAIYSTIVGREGDEEGVNFWIKEFEKYEQYLGEEMAIEYVLNRMFEESEFKNLASQLMA